MPPIFHTNDGIPHESVHGIREDTTSRGNDLAGAKITAIYADGSQEDLTWVALDQFTQGGVTGDDIDMYFTWDWHRLTTEKPLALLQIDLQPANSVFDINFDYNDYPDGNSTPGSYNGFPFELHPDTEDLGGDLIVTYSGIVNLRGSPARGDLYTTMTVDFSQLPGGGFEGELRWNSDIDTMKEDGDLVPAGVPCLVRGTLVTTDRGDVPVEDLRPGCKVLTQDGGFQELVLTMSRVVGASELRRNAKLYPVRIIAGALGSGLPKRDLVVSRQHRMVVQSNIVKRMFNSATALVAAVRLTELPGIYVDNAVESVEYFHLIFKKHEVVFAEGTPTESFLINSDTLKTLSKEQREEFLSLFPEVREIGYFGVPACVIPSNRLQKALVRRHVKNAKGILSL